MTKTFLLKGHATNSDTVIMVLEGKVVDWDEDDVPEEEIIGRDFAKALYNTLPSGTINAMMDELEELRT